MGSHLQQSPAQQVVDCLSRIYALQLTTASGGNVSVKDDQGNIWISPAGTDKSRLTVNDVVCVTSDGSQHGRRPASSELSFHQAIYQSRPDVNAVLHAHPDALVAFSAVGQLPDAGLLAGKVQACGNLGFAEYAMTGSELLGENIAECFASGADSVILENHGVVSAASDLQMAFQRFDALIHLAEAQLQAVALRPHTEIPESIAMGDQSWTGDSDHEWSSASELKPKIAKEICDYVQRSCSQRLFSPSSGWIAVRHGASMIINRVEDDRGLLVAEALLSVDFDLACMPGASGFLRSCVQIFTQHHDINVIFLAQPAYLMGFNLSGLAFNSRIIPEAYLFLRDVECLYSTDPQTIAMAISAASPVLMLKNTGVLVTGNSLFQAFDRLEVAEFTARALSKALNLGRVQPIASADIDEMIEAFDLPRV